MYKKLLDMTVFVVLMYIAYYTIIPGLSQAHEHTWITSQSSWGLYKRTTPSSCSNSISGFNYLEIQTIRTFELECISLCETNQECSSALFQDDGDGFGGCILANSVSGCPRADISWFEKVTFIFCQMHLWNASISMYFFSFGMSI